MAEGEVVFSIANGYDADMWDDSLLIRQYERACESSRRELKRRRKEAGKRKRNWELGDGCRVVYEEDGLEYEATIVKITSRKATVRLHGYKEELEVPVAELTDSLGQQYIQEQIVEAQMEEVSEDPYTGPVKVGKPCRAFWSLDGSVYEATIESIQDEKVTVRFIGYDNSGTVLVDELLESKGQEWRDLQVEDAKLDFEEENNNFNVDLDKLIQDNSDILSKLPMDNLSLDDNSDKKKSKSSKKEDKKGKSSKEGKKSKSDKKKNHTESLKMPYLQPDIEKLINEGGPIAGSFPGRPGGLPEIQPGLLSSTGLPELPNLLGMPTPLPDPTTNFLPPSGMSAGQMPVPGSLPGNPSMAGFLGGSAMAPPPPPSIDIMQSSNQQLLHSMLISWYLAGYHTGAYLGSQQQNLNQAPQTKKKKKKDVI